MQNADVRRDFDEVVRNAHADALRVAATTAAGNRAAKTAVNRRGINPRDDTGIRDEVVHDKIARRHARRTGFVAAAQLHAAAGEVLQNTTHNAVGVATVDIHGKIVHVPQRAADHKIVLAVRVDHNSLRETVFKNKRTKNYVGCLCQLHNWRGEIRNDHAAVGELVGWRVEIKFVPLKIEAPLARLVHVFQQIHYPKRFREISLRPRVFVAEAIWHRRGIGNFDDAVRRINAKHLDSVVLPFHAPKPGNPNAAVGERRRPFCHLGVVRRIIMKRAADRNGLAGTVRVSAGAIQIICAADAARRHTIHQHIGRVQIVVCQIVIGKTRKPLPFAVVKQIANPAGTG